MKPTDAGPSEQHWVQRAQAGDARALDWVVRTHVAMVERLLLRLLGRRQDLDDLVQNVFLETLRALPSYRGDSAFSTFVAAIAVRIARRALRPSLVTRLRASLHEELMPLPRQGPDAQVEAQRRLARVRRALAHLSEEKRVAFLLWALEGLPPEQIAKLMDASLPATRSRIHYAQKELLARAAKDAELREWLLERPHGQR